MSGSGALHRFDQQPDHGEDVLVGTFRFWFVGERWEWSDEVAAMHGYAPGSVVPTSALVLSHKHPDDRLHVQELLDRALVDVGQHRVGAAEGEQRRLREEGAHLRERALPALRSHQQAHGRQPQPQPRQQYLDQVDAGEARMGGRWRVVIDQGRAE